MKAIDLVHLYKAEKDKEMALVAIKENFTLEYMRLCKWRKAHDSKKRALIYCQLHIKYMAFALRVNLPDSEFHVFMKQEFPFDIQEISKIIEK
jgi:hypothetical protein